jgi:hypothetical protein
MHFHEMLDDCETQAEAAVRTREALVALPKAIKSERQELGAHTDPGVGDGNLDVRPDSRGPQIDASVLRCELDRVREKIPENLLKPLPITEDRRQIVRDVHAYSDLLCVGGRPHAFNGIQDDSREAHRSPLDDHSAGDHARDIQNVVDELRLGSGVSFNDLQDLDEPTRIHFPLTQHRNPSENRIQRRPKFVRKRRQELVLQPVCTLRIVTSGM